MARIEIEDIQGIVLRGYHELPYLSFVLLVIDDVAAARRWLAELLPEVTPASEKPVGSAVHVALTQAGLKKLELPEETLAVFSREFQEDVQSDDHRTRILGDQGNSSPDQWEWGGPTPKNSAVVDVALLLYAENDGLLARKRSDLIERCSKGGLREVGGVDAYERDDHKEHFGFRDGITQPWIVNENAAPEIDALKCGASENSVKPGEFLYGYEDELRTVPPSPHLSPSCDTKGILHRDGAGLADFGRNGTYLVARQLAQDVRGFWEFMFEHSKDVGQNPILLASKMVGRWPDGTPLVRGPQGPVPGSEDEAEFGYQKEGDAAGFKCPLGAHIRRANPRDALVDDPEQSTNIVKRHRLIRRGRPYGPRRDESMDPMRMLKAPNPPTECGLLFLAFNIHFSRQFEFVQQTWINNPKFSELSNDADPIAGSPAADATFTQQREPVRLRLRGIKSFVEVRGSGYFFVPGLAALRYLAEGGEQPGRATVPVMPFVPREPPADRPVDFPLDQPLASTAERTRRAT
jgi:deferrochelatase/peroxidase EfeB